VCCSLAQYSNSLAAQGQHFIRASASTDVTACYRLAPVAGQRPVSSSIAPTRRGGHHPEGKKFNGMSRGRGCP
jgi:hypothetical protein